MITEQTLPILETQKLSVKLDFAAGQEIGLDTFVPVFHHWIQRQALHDHLLIDVANYKHVVNGPGVLLIAHEANLSIDETDGRRGLLYVRKQPIGQSFAKRLGQIVGYTLELADLLEAEPELAGRVKLNRSGLTLRLHDRLRAANTPEAFEAIRSLLGDALTGALGGKVHLEHRFHPDRLFEVRATLV